MAQIVLFKVAGSPRVLFPAMSCGLTLEQILAKDLPATATDVNTVDTSALPPMGLADAFVWTGTGPVTLDLPAVWTLIQKWAKQQTAAIVPPLANSLTLANAVGDVATVATVTAELKTISAFLTAPMPTAATLSDLLQTIPAAFGPTPWSAD